MAFPDYMRQDEQRVVRALIKKALGHRLEGLLQFVDNVDSAVIEALDRKRETPV